MIIVSPSILAADFANLQRDIDNIYHNEADWVHVDVMDGLFVPNISIGIPVVSAVKKVSSLPLDVHLMIDRPLRYVDDFIKAGSDWLTIHIEADTEENTILALKKIRDAGCKAAISLKPGTPAIAAEPFLSLCDMVLVMTVEPGFGGQSFMEEMMPKLAELKEMIIAQQLDCLLSVDGGVNLTTGKICAANGADVLVAGSAFFKASDRKDFVNQLHKLV